jgi:hypothetical protein
MAPGAASLGGRAAKSPNGPPSSGPMASPVAHRRSGAGGGSGEVELEQLVVGALHAEVLVDALGPRVFFLDVQA